MASFEWYKFSGCCDNTVFQVQSLTPPANFVSGSSYYLLTDQYTGCTTLIGSGFTSEVQINILQSYSPQVFTNCNDCTIYYPCGTLPSPTPTRTPPPTPGFGLTPTPTNTVTKTPTNTITRTLTNTINQTPNVTNSLTPSVTNTRTNTPTQNAIYWFSGCCNNQNIVFGVINFTNVIPPNRFYYIEIINQFSICTTSITSGSGIIYDNSEIIITETDPYLGCNGCISQYGCDPIPTPSPTITNTITNTPTSTQTPTNTPSHSNTPSNTPTNTQTPSNTPTITQTQTPTITQTQTNTISSTPGFTPTSTQTPTKTPTNTTTITNTPSYTPSNTSTFTPTITKTQTPTNTSTVTNTPSYTPSNTVTPTKTNTPLPTLQSPPYSSTPTPTNTNTPSVSTGSGCLVSSYCISTNVSGYSGYNGTYINYGVINGFSVFYSPTSEIPSYIYYNTGLTQWCLSEYYNGIPVIFGPSNSNSVCPDFNSSILNTICPTPSPTLSLDNCESFNFEAFFNCDPSETPTPTPTTTLTPTPTTTLTPTQLCFGKSISVSGFTVPYSLGVIPTSSPNNVLKDCIITGETLFNTLNLDFSSSFSKLLIDCINGSQYLVSEPIPFGTGSTFSALIDGNPVCVTYSSNILSSPINVLNSIESGNLFDCFWCSPPYSPTPTVTSTNTPTTTLTPTKTPTSTKCLNTSVDFSFVVGSGISGGQVYDSYNLSDGRIILAGNFTSYRNTSINGLCIVKNDGSIDTTFTNTGVSITNLTSIAVDEVNKSIYCNSGSKNITKINFSGHVDTVFSSNIGPGFNFKVTKLLIHSATTGSCNVICVGPFTRFNNLTYNNLISLSENGLVSNYTNFKSFDSYPLNVAKDSENNLIFVGNFSSYDDQDYSRIIKLNPDGSINNSFSSYTFNDIVNNVLIDNQDNIYCSGKFTNYSSTTSNQIIKLLPSGVISETSSLSFGLINSISLNVNKNLIYVVGNFSASTVSNIGFNNIVSLNDDLSINYSFGSLPGFNGTITKIFTQLTDKLLIFGNFSSYNNLVGFNNIIRLYPCQTAIIPSPTPTLTPTTLTCSSIQSQGVVGSNPKYLAHDYNTNKYYVTNNTDGTISVIDSSLNLTTTLTPSTGTTSLEGVVYTPNGYFYIADSLNQKLYVYDSTGDTLVNTITISYTIKNLELSLINNQILLSTNSGEIVFFNYSLNLIDSVLPVAGGGEVFSRFDSINNRIFISSTIGNSIGVYDYTTNLITYPITLTSYPKDLILNSVNNLLYVVQPSSHQVSIFETSYYTQISTITLPHIPEYLTLSVYDNYIYVSSPGSNTILLINGNTNTYVCLGLISSSQQLIYNQNNSTIYGVSYDSNSIFELTQYTPVTPTPTTTPATPTPTPTITKTQTQTNTATPTLTPYCFTAIQSLDVGENTVSITYNSVDDLMYVGSSDSATVFVVEPSSFTVLSSVTLSIGASFFENMTYYSGTNSVYGSYASYSNIGILSGNTEYDVLSASNVRGLTVQPNEERIYIGGNSSIRILDLNTNTISSIGSLGSQSWFSVYNDIDNTIYFALDILNQVKVYDCSTSAITTTISVGVLPLDLTFNPLLNRVYVLNSTDDSISVIDCNTNTVTTTITGMSGVVSILYVPGSTTVLVGTNANNLYKIDCSTNTISCTYAITGNFTSMTYNTNDGLVYASDYNTNSIKRFSISYLPPSSTPAATSTNTPTVTNTQTLTQTNTITPSITQTITNTPTNTNTPTSSMAPCGITLNSIEYISANTLQFNTTYTPSCTGQTLQYSYNGTVWNGINFSCNSAYTYNYSSSAAFTGLTYVNIVNRCSAGLTYTSNTITYTGDTVSVYDWTGVTNNGSTSLYYSNNLSDYIAVGLFTTYGSQSVTNLIRLDESGILVSSPLSSFSSTTFGAAAVYHVHDYSNDSLLVSGAFNSYSGQSSNYLAVISNTFPYELKNTFSSPFTNYNAPNGAVNIITTYPLSNGKVMVVCPDPNNFSGFVNTRSSVIRLNSNGSFDNTYSSGFSSTAGVQLFIPSDESKLIIYGSMTSYSGVSFSGKLGILNTGGTINTVLSGVSGNTAFGNYIRGIKETSSGGYLIFGAFTQYSGVSANSIVKVDSNFNIDYSFSAATGGTMNYIDDCLELSDGRIIIVGNFSNLGGVYNNTYVFLNSNGSVDTSIKYGGPMVNRVVKEVSDGVIAYEFGLASEIAGNKNRQFVKIRKNGPFVYYP